jgi:hypothetical protein
MLRRLGMEILEQDHPRYLTAGLAARGSGKLAERVGRLPLRAQWYLSALLLPHLIAIARKP